MRKGLFLVLEGIDGAGTTTQGRLLADHIEAVCHRTVTLTAEPSEGPVGAIIRQILTGRLTHSAAGRHKPVDEETMALLFAADRSDHLRNTILPALKAGRVVISDRYYLSSVAYQSLGVDMAWVETLNSRFPRPDLTIWLDITPAHSLDRKRARAPQAERYEHLRFLARVRRKYEKAVERARAAGERIEILDSSQSVNVVKQQILDLAIPLLP